MYIYDREFLESYLRMLKKMGFGDNGDRDDKDFPCAKGLAQPLDEEIDNPFFGEGNDKEFWELCKKHYPLHSVHGGNTASSSELVIKREKTMFLNEIQDKIKGDKYKKTVLEIGFGFGGVGHYLMDKFGTDYYGIDYTYSNEADRDFTFKGKKRFYEIDKSGIPENLKNKKYDLIFSSNVFQHLTQEQRFQYIVEAYDLLKPGGVLYFNVFQPVDGVELPEGYSTHFFLVHTKIDSKEEIEDFLSLSGFTYENNIILQESKCTNWVGYTCKKSGKQ